MYSIKVDKDIVVAIKEVDVEQANRYCYCTLDILIENFENKQIAEEHLLKDPSLRLIWYENCK